MATKNATKVTGSTMSAYGRVGTAAELYKRLIAEFKLANEEAWSAVASALGVDAAGGPHYPGWYRRSMLKAGR